MRKIFTFLFVISLLLIFTTCKKSEDNPTDPTPTEENVTGTVSSTESGSIKTNSGYEIYVIPGTVPQNQNGQSAEVTFSIETPVTPPEEVSASVEKRGEYTKLGPEGFYFRWPVRVVFKYKNTTDPSELKLLHYDGITESWEIIPISMIDKTNQLVGADVLELGYFLVAKVGQNPPKTMAEDSDGGFEFQGDASHYYTLTVASVSNFKYPWQAAAWYSGSIVGSSGSTGSYPTGGPRPPTHIHLVQATYQMWISRTVPGTLSTLPKIYTYTVPATGTISQPVTYSGPLSSGEGWTTLSLPGGGEWVEGTPDGWPVPTVTYGTGDFQATLTWVNNSSHNSDVDLHLYGPDNMHIYYSNSSNAYLSLDRDWRYTYGNATENIFSTGTMPTGSYSVKVNLYGGDPVDFRVRIIKRGSSKSFNGRVTTVNSGDVEANMITADTFTW